MFAFRERSAVSGQRVMERTGQSRGRGGGDINVVCTGQYYATFMETAVQTSHYSEFVQNMFSECADGGRG